MIRHTHLVMVPGRVSSVVVGHHHETTAAGGIVPELDDRGEVHTHRAPAVVDIPPPAAVTLDESRYWQTRDTLMITPVSDPFPIREVS